MSKLWVGVLIVFLIALSAWAAFYVESPEHKIAIFAIIGAIITAVSSVLAIIINNNEAKQREFNLLLLAEKQKVFEHFYNSLFDIFANIKKRKGAAPSKKAVDELLMFRRGLMNWGSEELIRDYLDYEKKLEKAVGGDSVRILNVGNMFLKSLRREMGFQDSDKLNVMSLLLNAEAREELDT